MNTRNTSKYEQIVNLINTSPLSVKECYYLVGKLKQKAEDILENTYSVPEKPTKPISASKGGANKP